MQDSAVPRPPGFDRLTKAEQIEYLQDLWDSIASSPEELPVPETHLLLVEDRLAEYRRDPSRARPAMEALDEIARKLP